MKKIKKSDLRYGDVIRFPGQQVRFHAGTNMLGEYRPEFVEDTFLVDVLPPKRGKKLPELELRARQMPKYTHVIKGAFPPFEVVSRLPEGVQVFKTRAKNFGGMIHFSHKILTGPGETWDDKALVARDAMQAARALGCAAVVFKSFGYAEVWPFPEGVPPLEFLQQNVEDPYDTITVADTSRLNTVALPGVYAGPYLAYTGDNGLLVNDPVINVTAQFALLNDPQRHKELQQREWNGTELIENPDYEFGRYAGGVVVLVGFSICAETGDTIRTPIQPLAQAAD